MSKNLDLRYQEIVEEDDSAIRADMIEMFARELTVRIVKSPKSSDAFRIRGLLYSHLGKLESAQEDFQQSIELDPSEDNLVAYGNFLAAIEHFDNSNLHYQKALELNKNNLFACRGLSLVHSRQGSLSLAIRFAEQATAIDKTDSLSVFALAMALKLSGNWERAVFEFRKLVKLCSTNADYWYQFGLALEKLEKLGICNKETSIGAFSNSLKLDNSRATVYFRRGLRFLENGKTADARLDLDKAIILESSEERRRRYQTVLDRMT